MRIPPATRAQRPQVVHVRSPQWAGSNGAQIWTHQHKLVRWNSTARMPPPPLNWAVWVPNRIRMPRGFRSLFNN